jgi:hypothetical protein
VLGFVAKKYENIPSFEGNTWDGNVYYLWPAYSPKRGQKFGELS